MLMKQYSLMQFLAEKCFLRYEMPSTGLPGCTDILYIVNKTIDM